MRIKLDFNSPEAIYIQLRNQIVMQIAQEQLHEGDSLPSVRGLAGELGVNMHTVNKAYAMLLLLHLQPSLPLSVLRQHHISQESPFLHQAAYA